MRRVYGEAERTFGEANAEIEGALGPGYAGSAAQREAAGAGRRLAESKAGALSELSSREVDARAAAEYGIRQAKSQFKQDVSKINEQVQELESEMGTYLATTYRDLKEADRKYKLEKRRVALSERQAKATLRSTIATITGIDPATGKPTQAARSSRAARRAAARTEARLQRGTEADITGIDPLTGKPTAAERARRKAAREAAREDRGPTAGAVTKHQDLVASIQDAARAARTLRSNGGPWNEIPGVLSMNRTEDNPNGGFSEVVAAAGAQLARNGRLSPSMVRQLKARGLLPRRAPRRWRNPPTLNGTGVFEGVAGPTDRLFG